MRSGSAAPLSGEAVDLTPGLVALLPGAAPRCEHCTSCGTAAADGATPVASRIPPWFHVAGAVFFGLAYYGAVERLWPQGPLGAANHVYRRNALHNALLEAAPVAMPLLFLALLGTLGFILFRARDLQLPSCASCRRRERRFRWGLRLAGPALVAIAALALHAASGLDLPILAVGVVLLPFVFAREILRRLLPALEGGVAVARARGGAWLVSAPPAAERVLRKEAPAQLAPERPASRLYALGWALPLVVALFVSFMLPRAVRGQACPYGAIPMQWTEAEERHHGCMTPSGDRHGPWRGRVAGQRRWEARFAFDRLQRETAIWITAEGERLQTTRLRRGLPADPRAPAPGSVADR
jgi:hypothetical protein